MKAPTIRPPPGLRPHFLHPTPRHVPVVVDVVVVEDHRCGHGREQPANLGLRPRLAVEGVYSSKSAIPGPSHGRVAAALDELEGGGGHLVRIHLISEQKKRVGPFSLAALTVQYVQRASMPISRKSSGHGSVSRVGGGPPTRHEPKTSRARSSWLRVRTTGCGRPSEAAERVGRRAARRASPTPARDHCDTTSA